MPYKDPLAQKAAQAAWYQRNKQVVLSRTKDKRNKARIFVRNYKLENSVCSDCGISYPPHILDFDHVGEKSFQIGGNNHKGRSIESIKKEIEKCEVVCANCHRHRTYMRSVNKQKNKES